MGKRSNGTRNSNPASASQGRRTEATAQKKDVNNSNTYKTANGTVYEYDHLYSKGEEERITKEINEIESSLNIKGLKRYTVHPHFDDIEKVMREKGLELSSKASLNMRLYETFKMHYHGGIGSESSAKKEMEKYSSEVESSFKVPHYTFDKKKSARVVATVHISPTPYFRGQKSNDREYNFSIEEARFSAKGYILGYKDIKRGWFTKDEMLKALKKYGSK